MILLGTSIVTHKYRDEPWNTVVPVMQFCDRNYFQAKTPFRSHLPHTLIKRLLDNSVRTI